jgi:hypothetical protein
MSVPSPLSEMTCSGRTLNQNNRRPQTPVSSSHDWRLIHPEMLFPKARLHHLSEPLVEQYLEGYVSERLHASPCHPSASCFYLIIQRLSITWEANGNRFFCSVIQDELIGNSANFGAWRRHLLRDASPSSPQSPRKHRHKHKCGMARPLRCESRGFDLVNAAKDPSHV